MSNKEIENLPICLLAAAPALLEALKAAAHAIEEEVAAAGDDKHPVIQGHAAIARKARKAIRLAEGESQ